MGCRFMYQVESKMTFLFMSLFFLIRAPTNVNSSNESWNTFPFPWNDLRHIVFTYPFSCWIIDRHEDISSLLWFYPSSWASWCWKHFKIRFLTLYWSFLSIIWTKEVATWRLNKLTTCGNIHLDFHFHIWNDTAEGRNAIHVAVADWPYFGLISSLSIVLRG